MIQSNQLKRFADWQQLRSSAIQSKPDQRSFSLYFAWILRNKNEIKIICARLIDQRWENAAPIPKFVLQWIPRLTKVPKHGIFFVQQEAAHTQMHLCYTYLLCVCVCVQITNTSEQQCHWLTIKMQWNVSVFYCYYYFCWRPRPSQQQHRVGSSTDCKDALQGNGHFSQLIKIAFSLLLFVLLLLLQLLLLNCLLLRCCCCW